MKFSERAAAFLAELEGVKYKAYKDAGGKWTIGVGHLIKKGEEHLLRATLTKPETISLLMSDVKESETVVNQSVKMPLTQQQFDALVILVFNIGTGNFLKSSVLRELNSKDYMDAYRHFDDWNKIRNYKGVLQFCQGLQNRRDEEQELFLNGDYTKQR